MQTQKAAGFGYESYTATDLVFMGIQNIHAVRDSFKKVQALAMDPNNSDADWDSAIADTAWLTHVRLIIEAGIFTARALHLKGASVLVHCRYGCRLSFVRVDRRHTGELMLCYSAP